MQQIPEEHDPPPLGLLLIALGVATWAVILFGIGYTIYRLVN